MTSMTLYVTPGTCALATHIALAEAGADYSVRHIDFESGQQRSPDYLKINPKGRVPALVTPQGILTETPAMLLYVAQMHPASGQAPLDDPFALARMQAVTSFICSTLHVAHAHRMRGHRWTDDPAAQEALKKMVPQTVGEAFSLVETTMLEGPWVMGDSYSVADGYLYTVAQWLEKDGVDPAAVPGVIDHRTRMAQRPAVVRALTETADAAKAAAA